MKKLLAIVLGVLMLTALLPASLGGMKIAEAAGASTAKVYNWKQGDSKWSNLYKSLKWSKACAVVSIAAQIARTDLVRVNEKATTFNTTTKEGFNPATFAKVAVQKGVISTAARIQDWNKVKSVVPGFLRVKKDYKPKSSWSYGKNAFSYYPSKTKQDIVDAMTYYLSLGYYPIVEGPGSNWANTHDSRHYVAVISVTSNDVKIMDPADGKVKSIFSRKNWTPANIDKCGIPNGYGCAMLYRVDPTYLLVSEFKGTVEFNPEDVQFRGTTPYVIANGSAQTPRIIVKDEKGNVVDPSRYTCQYLENTNAGTGYVNVTFTSEYSGSAQAWFKIYLPATTSTRVDNVKDGIRIRWEPVDGADGYVIYRRAWSNTTNGWTTFERWNNTPNLSWTDTTVYAGSCYQYGIKAYFAQRVDPVSGATIGGNVGDNYNLGEVGPLKNTARITTRTLKSVWPTQAKGELKANWDASKVFTGYHLQVATDPKFTENKQTITVYSDNATLSNLLSNTEYYVRVRSFHIFDGATYYGQWSNVLSYKTY